MTELEQLRVYAGNSDRIAMELTAALAMMDARDFERDEYLRREAVMELVTSWRMKWDALQKDRPKAKRPEQFGVGGDLQAESIERCLKCGVRFLTTEHEEPMCAQHSVSPPSQDRAVKP